MITFILSVALLVGGYFVYGTFMEKIFGIERNRPTPAYSMRDGVDYVPMKTWRIFLIQFLNIAGLGPIFGAVMGVMYGPSAFLWIVLGSIFGGAVHDYLAGMMSLRSNGASLTELIGQNLGLTAKRLTTIFTVLLMVIVGAVFISGPAKLLTDITGGFLGSTWWIVLIFIYYILATLLPVDKIIGKVYPVFGVALLFMASGIFVCLFIYQAPIPELTFESLHNFHPHPDKYPLFPMMFISIACGAISGFHATQSPLMARCMKNEGDGKRVYYGSMITEALVALVWAAAGMSFFGSVEGLNSFLADNGNEAAVAVNKISREWLGAAGGVLALLGVVFAPITSGDTAFRSARLIVADFFGIEQKSFLKRVMIAVPLFVLCFILLQMDFSIIWRYFAWGNQTLAAVTLWCITVYLARLRKLYWVTLLPAMFMTCVIVTYILSAPEGLSLPYMLSVWVGVGISMLCGVLFFIFAARGKRVEAGVAS